MNSYKILGLVLLFAIATSCKSESQKIKEAKIQQSISQMKTERKSANAQVSKELNVETSKPLNSVQSEHSKEQTSKQIKSQDSKADNIVGVWEVKNDYYMAIYEIEKYQGKYR